MVMVWYGRTLWYIMTRNTHTHTHTHGAKQKRYAKKCRKENVVLVMVPLDRRCVNASMDIGNGKSVGLMELTEKDKCRDSTGHETISGLDDELFDTMVPGVGHSGFRGSRLRVCVAHCVKIPFQRNNKTKKKRCADEDEATQNLRWMENRKKTKFGYEKNSTIREESSKSFMTHKLKLFIWRLAARRHGRRGAPISRWTRVSWHQSAFATTMKLNGSNFFWSISLDHWYCKSEDSMTLYVERVSIILITLDNFSSSFGSCRWWTNDTCDNCLCSFCLGLRPSLVFFIQYTFERLHWKSKWICCIFLLTWARDNWGKVSSVVHMRLMISKSFFLATVFPFVFEFVRKTLGGEAPVLFELKTNVCIGVVGTKCPIGVFNVSFLWSHTSSDWCLCTSAIIGFIYLSPSSRRHSAHHRVFEVVLSSQCQQHPMCVDTIRSSCLQDHCGKVSPYLYSYIKERNDNYWHQFPQAYSIIDLQKAFFLIVISTRFGFDLTSVREEGLTSFPHKSVYKRQHRLQRRCH